MVKKRTATATRARRTSRLGVDVRDVVGADGEGIVGLFLAGWRRGAGGSAPIPRLPDPA
ncbi:hypothetical protein [Clavibacter tessellarius]|uniref:hypothetical protein n=1 Tax=Clavibacter tessellarius TaxID=31965 RepID=UPI0032438471